MYIPEYLRICNSVVEPKIFPAPDALIRYLENYLFDLNIKIKITSLFTKISLATIIFYHKNFFKSVVNRKGPKPELEPEPEPEPELQFVIPALGSGSRTLICNNGTRSSIHKPILD